MLGRTRRLNRALFDRIRKSTHVIGGGPISLRFMKALSPGRFSVVVPKTLAGSAVARNKARRQVYEVILPIQVGFNGIFYLRKMMNFDVVRKEVAILMREAQKNLSTLK